MKFWNSFFGLTLILQLLFSLTAEAAVPYPTVNTSGQLMLNGAPYRAIGVNYYSAFYRTLFYDRDTSYVDGFATLKKYNIPFARVMLSGYWPKDWNLYMTNKSEYFSRMDKVVHAAEVNNVGIIASLQFCASCVSDLVGEPFRAWGNPNSKTIAFMRNYVTEVVTRYKNSPAIWGWEFGNELPLAADLPNAPQFRPPVYKRFPSDPEPINRDDMDDLKSADFDFAFAEFAKAVRAVDSVRMIDTGNSLPRPYAYHNSTSNSWGQDSPDEFCQVLHRDNPAEYNLISVHIYHHHIGKYFNKGADSSLDQIIKVAASCAKQTKQALYIGEFGTGQKFNDPMNKSVYHMFLNAIVRNPVALATDWVFDYEPQNETYNISVKNNLRIYVLEGIMSANQQLKANGYKP